MKKPKLEFDFYPNTHSVCFSNPIEIITTNDLKKVTHCLKQVKEKIANNYYVAGFVSYEASYAFYKTNRTIDSDFPLLWFGVFNEPTFKQTSQGYPVEEHASLNWEMLQSKETYIAKINEILNMIKEGELEQVNYTVPFKTDFSLDSYRYYEQLKQAQKSNYNAFIRIDQYDILSISPEKFFEIKKGIVSVKPMKGTVARGLTFEEDQERAIFLQQSEKNKAENQLTVELMESELKKVASDVTIYDRYQIERFPTVYQMTSSIKGKLKKSIDPVDVFIQLFPAGSITGVAKDKAIEKIDELEPFSRGVYCGAIGYFTPEEEALFNVAIRTVAVDHHKKEAFYYAGGAITKDSIPEEEYDEVIAKTAVLDQSGKAFELLETMLLENGVIFLKESHLDRLKTSATYFNFSFPEKKLRSKLDQIKETYDKGKFRLRLLLNSQGDCKIEVAPLEKLLTRNVVLAKEPIDPSNKFLYHKTTERKLFDSHRHMLHSGCLDVLLWNDKYELTEFTIGNIVVEINGKLLTPPQDAGLLAGTFRKKLLKEGKIKEARITIDDLNKAKQIWLINSVRKWVKVNLIK